MKVGNITNVVGTLTSAQDTKNISKSNQKGPLNNLALYLNGASTIANVANTVSNLLPIKTGTINLVSKTSSFFVRRADIFNLANDIRSGDKVGAVLSFAGLVTSTDAFNKSGDLLIKHAKNLGSTGIRSMLSKAPLRVNLVLVLASFAKSLSSDIDSMKLINSNINKSKEFYTDQLEPSVRIEFNNFLDKFSQEYIQLDNNFNVSENMNDEPRDNPFT